MTTVLDLIHVAQYVRGAAAALLPEDKTARRDWVTEKLQLVLWGEASTAATAMRRSASKHAMKTKDRAPIDTYADYLLKYKQYLNYDLPLRDGLPISTGVVECACRHLVKDRMEITGARWDLDTAEAVLRLRGLAVSGDPDEYFHFHEDLELRRNHLSRYANGTPPALTRTARPRLPVVA